MALTTLMIRRDAKPKTKAYKLEDEDGMYLLVEPDGSLNWRLKYHYAGKNKELELGAYPEISLSDARKKRSNAHRLITQGIDPKVKKKSVTSKPKKNVNAKPDVKDNMDVKQNQMDEGTQLSLIAYRLNQTKMPLVTAYTNREWMDQTANRFAYRCMPMLIANQAGWMVLSGHDIGVIWDGRQTNEGLKIKCLSGDMPCPALSVFGSGIITFTLPYLFRTPPGYNLLAQGPPNWPKDGVSPLAGIVETDWSEATFTMNWKITRPHHTITFEKGDPICMITPQRRFEVERFRPEIRDITSDPVLHADYLQWADSRRKFNSDLKKNDPDARKKGWQKHYAQGKTVSEKRSDVHQSKLNLHEFSDMTKAPESKK